MFGYTLFNNRGVVSRTIIIFSNIRMLSQGHGINYITVLDVYVLFVAYKKKYLTSECLAILLPGIRAAKKQTQKSP